MVNQSSGKRAVMFADISGSSALYKRCGNQTAKALVDFILDAMGQLVVQYNGTIIKSIGDEIMTSFESCHSALKAANEMQLKFCELTQSHQLSLSIGVGFGKIICEQQDLFGEAVNDAAYLTHLAKGGEVLLTEAVYFNLNSEVQARTRIFDKIIIKGATEASNIYRIYWQSGNSETSETKFISSEQIVENLDILMMKVVYQKDVYFINSEQTPFVFGRELNQCDLVVEGQQVSRKHCQIQYRRGKFVLIDHSTNGCYITQANQDEIYLRREEYPISGKVFLSLGTSILHSSTQMLELTV